MRFPVLKFTLLIGSLQIVLSSILQSRQTILEPRIDQGSIARSFERLLGERLSQLQSRFPDYRLVDVGILSDENDVEKDDSASIVIFAWHPPTNTYFNTRSIRGSDPPQWYQPETHQVPPGPPLFRTWDLGRRPGFNLYDAISLLEHSYDMHGPWTSVSLDRQHKNYPQVLEELQYTFKRPSGTGHKVVLLDADTGELINNSIQQTNDAGGERGLFLVNGSTVHVTRGIAETYVTGKQSDHGAAYLRRKLLGDIPTTINLLPFNFSLSVPRGAKADELERLVTDVVSRVQAKHPSLLIETIDIRGRGPSVNLLTSDDLTFWLRGWIRDTQQLVTTMTRNSTNWYPPTIRRSSYPASLRQPFLWNPSSWMKLTSLLLGLRSRYQQPGPWKLARLQSRYLPLRTVPNGVQYRFTKGYGSEATELCASAVTGKVVECDSPYAEDE